MTCFPLAEGGGVFIAMGYFLNAAVVPQAAPRIIPTDLTKKKNTVR